MEQSTNPNHSPKNTGGEKKNVSDIWIGCFNQSIVSVRLRPRMNESGVSYKALA